MANPGYRVVTDYAIAGPLLLGPDPSTDFNQAVARAEAGLPEGARVVLQIDSVNAASTVISQLNSAYENGQIKNPQTGELIQGWPEYPGKIAFPFNSGNGVELRWVKGQPWIPILIVVIAAIAVAVILSLQHSPYRMLTPSGTPSGGGSGSSSASPPWFGYYGGTLYILRFPWYWSALAGTALLVGPWAVSQVARLEESESEYLEARQELASAKGAEENGGAES